MTDGRTDTSAIWQIVEIGEIKQRTKGEKKAGKKCKKDSGKETKAEKKEGTKMEMIVKRIEKREKRST